MYQNVKCGCFTINSVLMLFINIKIIEDVDGQVMRWSKFKDKAPPLYMQNYNNFTVNR